MNAKIPCNGDCLNCKLSECPYPDVPQDVLDAPLTRSEYECEMWIESDLICGKKNQSEEILRKQREYRLANRDKINAKRKEWGIKNADREKERKKIYYEANRDWLYSKKKELIRKNKRKLCETQRKIKTAREKHGLTKKQLGDKIGVSEHTIQNWEFGYYPAKWDKLCAVLPELEEHRKGG